MLLCFISHLIFCWKAVAMAVPTTNQQLIWVIEFNKFVRTETKGHTEAERDPRWKKEREKRGKKLNDFTLCGSSTVNRYERQRSIICLWNWIHLVRIEFSGLEKCDEKKSHAQNRQKKIWITVLAQVQVWFEVQWHCGFSGKFTVYSVSIRSEKNEQESGKKK